jgi:hypothetical protein
MNKQKVLLLSTIFEKGYWTKNRIAPFKNLYPEILEYLESNWKLLNNFCPMYGIGYYKDSNDLSKCNSNENFDFIKILSINKNIPNDFSVQTEFIKKSNTSSKKINDSLPRFSRYIIKDIDYDKIDSILKTFCESFPKVENVNNIETIDAIKKIEYNEKRVLNWKDYLGDYFKGLLNLPPNAYNEFEDRIFQLLISIGFDVEQKGYKKEGSYPDGIAKIDDFTIIYDCKNSNEFFLDIACKRAMDDYIKDEKFTNNSKEIIPIFIVKKSSIKNIKSDYRIFEVEPLLYLFYTKIILGNKFNLNLIKKIIGKNLDFNIVQINKDFYK